MENNIKSLTIIGKKWTQKLYGNTYFSSEILINGELVHKIKCQYGYGKDFEWVSWAWVVNKYNLNVTRYSNGSLESVSSWCRKNNVTYSCHESTVMRKKDL